jgi:hypothetical protein
MLCAVSLMLIFFRAPCSQTPSVCVLPFGRETCFALVQHINIHLFYMVGLKVFLHAVELCCCRWLWAHPILIIPANTYRHLDPDVVSLSSEAETLHAGIVCGRMQQPHWNALNVSMLCPGFLGI